MLSEVIRLYIEDHEGKTWSPRTAQMTKSELARFLEIVQSWFANDMRQPESPNT